MDDDLIAAHGDVPQLMPYLHLPVQSGSDRILDAMNRGHGRDLYLRMVERLRDARPDLALSSDFIVGFPGESDADFDDTMRLVDEIGFASAYTFKYSRRPGTPGAALTDQVPENVKVGASRRAAGAARAAGSARSTSPRPATTVPVLFAEPGRKPGQMHGQDARGCSRSMSRATPRLIGRIVDVRLLAAYANSLLGEIVTAAVVRGGCVSDPAAGIARRRRPAHDVRRQCAGGRRSTAITTAISCASSSSRTSS